MLQQLRAEAGLSYQHLSERSHVDVGYLHRLETGKASRPGRDVLIRIGIGLGLDITGLDTLITAAGHWPLLRDQNGGTQPGSPRAA
jgi:transcriptional regulator with XRE-family HTH domain